MQNGSQHMPLAATSHSHVMEAVRPGFPEHESSIDQNLPVFLELRLEQGSQRQNSVGTGIPSSAVLTIYLVTKQVSVS
jgi:hypothetical protein